MKVIENFFLKLSQQSTIDWYNNYFNKIQFKKIHQIHNSVYFTMNYETSCISLWITSTFRDIFLFNSLSFRIFDYISLFNSTLVIQFQLLSPELFLTLSYNFSTIQIFFCDNEFLLFPSVHSDRNAHPLNKLPSNTRSEYCIVP